MTTMREGVVEYLALRRSLGFTLRKVEWMLGHFLQYVESNGAEGIAAPFHNAASSISECLEQGLGPMGGGWTPALLRVFEVSAGAIRYCGMTLFPQLQATGNSAPFIDVALAARVAADKDHYRTWKDAWDDRAWSLLDRFATETLAAASGRTADAVRKSRSRRGIE